jgi:hypothetical protein
MHFASPASDFRSHGRGIGNALTPLAKPLSIGALQADGSTRAEATFDVQHVADVIVHVAGLPTSVQVLELNIMCVSPLDFCLGAPPV